MKPPRSVYRYVDRHAIGYVKMMMDLAKENGWAHKLSQIIQRATNFVRIEVRNTFLEEPWWPENKDKILQYAEVVTKNAAEEAFKANLSSQVVRTTRRSASTMPNDLRSKLIRLAATMPKKSSERAALLRVLASEVEFAGSAPEHYKKKFAADLSKLAGDAGRLTYLRFDDPRAGGGWTAIFSTEFAALRVYYEWRKVNGINLGKAVTPGGGWYVSRIT